VVLVQYPDFFGQIQDFSELAKAVHEKGSLLCVCINPIALGLLKTPGEMGADIVVGEGQPLGIPLSYGGPYLGIFTTRKELIRKVSGRIVGETVDNRGQRAYVLTLTAREQHIRREKATSNICSNQGLNALTAAIYLSLLGRNGLQAVAKLCYDKAHYTAKEISKIHGYRILNQRPFFHEFVVSCPQAPSDINQHLLDHGMIGGYDLSEEYPMLGNAMLIAVTEMINKEDIDDLCELLKEGEHHGRH
jgi:glycine dehydrogenase subunit 1